MNRNVRRLLSADVEARLNSLVQKYFASVGNNLQENKDLHESLNDEWKTYITKVASRNKNYAGHHDSFERMVQRTLMVTTIMRKDPEANAAALHALSLEELTEQFEIAKRII